MYAQLPVGPDPTHATTIRMNTDSAYMQTQSQGWLVFSTSGFTNISSNVINLKTTLVLSSSRIVQYDTVSIKIINLYDSTLTLVSTDTISRWQDTLSLNNTGVQKDSRYYIQTIANYPCNTCNYPNEPIAFQLKLIGEPPNVLCELPACGFSAVIGDTTTNCTYGCVQAGGSEQYNGPCVYHDCIKGCSTSFSVSYSTTFCDDLIPDNSTYLNYLQSFHNDNNRPKETVTVCNKNNIYIAPLVHCAGHWGMICRVPNFTVNIGGNSVPAVYVNLYNTSNGTITNYSVSSWPFHLPPNALQPNVLYVVDYTYIDLSIPNYCYEYPGNVPHTTSCCQYYLRYVEPSVTLDTLSCAQNNLGSVCINFHFPMDSMQLASAADPDFANYCDPSVHECALLDNNGEDLWSFTGTITDVNGQTMATFSITPYANQSPDKQLCFNLPPGSYTLNAQLNMPTPCYCNFPTQFTHTFTILGCCSNSKPQNITLTDVTLVPANTPNAIPCSSLSPNNFYTGLIAVPPSGTINGAVLTIYGNLNINTPLTISKSDLLFADGASMSISPSKNVTIHQSYLHGCTIWHGIYLGNNVTLSFQHSVIEDAIRAINSFNIFGVNNVNISIQNALFNKTITAVSLVNTIATGFSIKNSIITSRKLNPAQYNIVLSASGTPPNFNSFFTPTYLSTRPAAFTSSISTTFPGFTNKRSQTGIFLFNSKSATSLATNYYPIYIGVARTAVTSPTFESSTTTIFDYLNTAISCTNSDAYVINNLFQNIFITNPANNFGNSQGSILYNASKLSVGENLISYGADNRFSNDFKNCIYGAYLSNGKGFARFFNNRFFGCKTSVYITQWNNNTPNLFIHQNTATNNNLFFHSFNNTLINASVISNTVTNGNPHQIYIQELSPTNNHLFDIRDNRLTGAYFPINVSNAQGVNIVNNYINFQKVPPYVVYPFSYQTGIEFSNVINSIVADNYIFCSPPGGSINTNIIGINIQQSSNNNYYCNDIEHVGKAIQVAGNSPSSIHSNTLCANTNPLALYGIFGIGGAWVGNIQGPNSTVTYHVTNNNQWGKLPNQFFVAAIWQILSFGSKAYYFPNTSSPDYPLISSLPTALADAPNFTSCAPPPPVSSNPILTKNTREFFNIRPIITMPERKITDKQVFEVVKKAGTSVSTMTDAINFITSMQSSNIDLFYKADSLAQHSILLNNPSLITQAEYLNNTIVPVDSVELIQKQWNDLYFLFLKGDSLIGNSEKQQLKQLAQLCPYRVGTSVYQARALLKHYDSAYYFNACEINYPPSPYSPNHYNNRELIQKENEEIHQYAEYIIRVFPNPLTDHQELNVISNEDVDIEISDIDGKVIISQAISKWVVNKIDLSNKAKGMYLYKIIKNNRVIRADKILIQ